MKAANSTAARATVNLLGVIVSLPSTKNQREREATPKPSVAAATAPSVVHGFAYGSLPASPLGSSRGSGAGANELIVGCLSSSCDELMIHCSCSRVLRVPLPSTVLVTVFCAHIYLSDASARLAWGSLLTVYAFCISSSCMFFAILEMSTRRFKGLGILSLNRCLTLAGPLGAKLRGGLGGGDSDGDTSCASLRSESVSWSPIPVPTCEGISRLQAIWFLMARRRRLVAMVVSGRAELMVSNHTLSLERGLVLVVRTAGFI